MYWLNLSSTEDMRVVGKGIMQNKNTDYSKLNERLCYQDVIFRKCLGHVLCWSFNFEALGGTFEVFKVVILISLHISSTLYKIFR